MSIYNEIIETLKADSESQGKYKNITELFIRSELEFYDFDNILSELQDEGIIKYKSEIETSGLFPVSRVDNQFDNIVQIKLGSEFKPRFQAKITYKGLKST